MYNEATLLESAKTPIIKLAEYLLTIPFQMLRRFLRYCLRALRLSQSTVSPNVTLQDGVTLNRDFVFEHKISLDLDSEGESTSDEECSSFPEHSSEHGMPLHFKLEEDGGDFSEKWFPFLSSYLQPEFDMTLGAKVQSTIDLLAEEAASTNESYNLSMLYIELAEQIPYHHPSQLKLARLVKRIGESEKAIHVSESGRRHWAHDKLGMVMRDNLMPDVNFQAFAAVLTKVGAFRGDITWALWAQREAHEEDVSTRWTATDEDAFIAHDGNVLSAAQWILWYGKGFFKQVLCPGTASAHDLRCWKPGPLYKGEAYPSLHRWHFWRDAYMVVASRKNEKETELGLECMAVALRAVNEMDALEKRVKA